MTGHDLTMIGRAYADGMGCHRDDLPWYVAREAWVDRLAPGDWGAMTDSGRMLVMQAFGDAIRTAREIAGVAEPEPRHVDDCCGDYDCAHGLAS